MSKKKLYTIPEFAIMNNVSRQYIWQVIDAGKLEILFQATARKIGRYFIVEK